MHNPIDIINLIKAFVSNQDGMEYECVSNDMGVQIFIYFSHSMMSLDVCFDDYKPYHCLAINGVCIDSHSKTHYSGDLIYFYYDDEKTDIVEIDQEIRKAYRFLSTFDLDWFARRLGDIGYITPNSIKYVHPDDIDLYEDCNTDRVVCVGTFAQYLLVKLGDMDVRILDEGINWQ